MMRSSSFALLLVVASAVAQDAPPGPAPELKRLTPLIGNWQGAGTATLAPGAPPTKWTAKGTFRWCLDDHWVQEDFRVDFEGVPAPMVIHGYWGWDRDQARYVELIVTNAGEVKVEDVAILPDGSMLQVLKRSQGGMPYAERSLLAVQGDEMRHAIDLFLVEGASTSVIDAKFHRTDQVFDGAWDARTFDDAQPAPAMRKLGKCAGEYALTGEFVMAPGAPPIRIEGTDTFRSVFGGTVMHGTTVGTPGPYRGEVFWAWEPARKCLVAAFVSNMGELAQMDAWFTKDGKFLSTSHGTVRGEPMVQRMVMEMDADGRPKSVLSHMLLGDRPPFEAYRSTYRKK